MSIFYVFAHSCCDQVRAHGHKVTAWHETNKWLHRRCGFEEEQEFARAQKSRREASILMESFDFQFDDTFLISRLILRSTAEKWSRFHLVLSMQPSTLYYSNQGAFPSTRRDIPMQQHSNTALATC